MNKCIEDELLNEICTIKTENNNIIGRITDISSKMFSVSTISSSNEKFELNRQIEIIIQTINNEVYLIKASCESIEKLEDSITLTKDNLIV